MEGTRVLEDGTIELITDESIAKALALTLTD
jgi:hypothetical protein